MCPKSVLIALLLCFVCMKSLTDRTNYISHTFEPREGDKVKNTNPKCLHYTSEGIVLGVNNLNNGMGKVITYLVLNNGKAFNKGDKLTKTMDQIEPCG